MKDKNTSLERGPLVSFTSQMTLSRKAVSQCGEAQAYFEKGLVCHPLEPKSSDGSEIMIVSKEKKESIALKLSLRIRSMDGLKRHQGFCKCVSAVVKSLILPINKTKWWNWRQGLALDGDVGCEIPWLRAWTQAKQPFNVADPKLTSIQQPF